MNEIERDALSSDLLRTFLVIAECGNLTLAAARLCRTQSAISVQLRKLETELKASLFHRTPKGMSMTDAGEALLPVSRRVLAELDRARTLFEAPLTGKIRIGIPDDFEDAILERTLADFSRRHPGVDVIATSGCTSGFPDAVRNGALDIAVYSGPEGTIDNAFATEPTIWAAGESAVLPPGAPAQLAILDRRCWWRDLPIRAMEEQGRRYSVAFKSSSFSSLKAAIRAGFAIGVLPASCLGRDMRALSVSEGFPRLPASSRTVLIGSDAPEKLTGAMSAAIQDACH